MMKLLFENFDTLAEAPEGIPKLREMVLQFAIEGKLVSQSLNDESAEILFSKIRRKIETLQKDGTIKHQNVLLSFNNNETPFQIPKNWYWTTLSAIGLINPRNNAKDDIKAAFVPMSLISAEYGKPIEMEIKKWGDIKKGFTHFAENDVSLAKITPCFENKKSAVMRNLNNGIGAGTTELHIFRPIGNTIVPEYILIYLKSRLFIETGKTKMTGSAGQKRVPKEYFSFSPFPLPPFNEQKRIVAKVDSLMVLCDELEKQQQQKAEKKVHLNKASLNSLHTSATRQEFNKNWNIITRNFDLLYSTPENVNDLKQTILQLAVQGKLTERWRKNNPNGEPASVLLEKIKQEKEKQIAEGKIRRQKLLPPIKDSEKPFKLPVGWEWARLGEIVLIRGGKRVSNGYKLLTSPTPYIYIRVSDMQDGSIDDSDLHYIDQHMHEKIKKYIITKNDLYMTIVGATIGKCGLVPDKFNNMNLTENAARLTPFQGVVREYLFKVLSSSFCQSQFLDKTKQVGVQKMALIRLSSTLIPLPTENEQLQIIANLVSFMALCDELEKHQQNISDNGNSLLNSILNRM